MIAGRVRQEIAHITQTGAKERLEVVQKFGGRNFDSSPRGLIQLFTVSC
jgi:hypothetical protein